MARTNTSACVAALDRRPSPLPARAPVGGGALTLADVAAYPLDRTTQRSGPASCSTIPGLGRGRGFAYRTGRGTG